MPDRPRIIAYCDSPTAGTGFGRSAQHVLGALHQRGYEIEQVAVNHDPATTSEIPWRVHQPTDRAGDPYGLRDLANLVLNGGPFDMLWTTFDPEVPWSYKVPGVEPQSNALGLFTHLRQQNPGFKMLGWFPVDGGPLSDFELHVLGGGVFDVVATMAGHVYDLCEWSLALRGQKGDSEKIREAIQVVPHGVDFNLYRIASDEERRAAKASLGFDPDAFLVVQVERNQQRKQVWQAFDVIERVRKLRPDAKVALYQHMEEDEENGGARCGWQLRDLCWRYGLKADVDVRWRSGRVSEAEMVSRVYAAADVVLSVSSGEGFQYPLYEALACGRRVLAPNDSARRAWLAATPNVFLYKSAERSEVFRGGYNRRMNRADVTAAAGALVKMIDGRPKFSEAPEAGRDWAQKTVDMNFVQEWWVRAVEQQYANLREERRAKGVSVDEKGEVVVSLREHPGYGDVVLAAPAIRAFCEEQERADRSVTVALPNGPEYLFLAKWLGLGHAVQIQPRVPLERLGSEVYDVSSLWHPTHRNGWSDPAEDRARVIARFLGVVQIDGFSLPAIPNHVSQAQAMLRQTFDVEPYNCVAICGESGVPSRSLPQPVIEQVALQVRDRGLTPVLLGRRRLNARQVGVLDLTGQTDIQSLVAMLASVRAAICVDSGPMHFAATVGTPLVAICPLFPATSRLSHYAEETEIRSVEPETCPEGEQWPPGKDGSAEWVASIRPAQILDAFDSLAGEGDSPPAGPDDFRIIRA